MEFHVSRAVRSKTGVDDQLFNYAGNVIFGNLTASREFVKRFNEARAATGEDGPVLHAGALFAMGLIDELNHAVIARYRETVDPELLPQALRWLQAKENREQVDKLLLDFADEFPVVAVLRGQHTAAEWLASRTSAAEAGTRNDVPNREIAIEELLMLWLANINPAFVPFKELFDDRGLGRKTVYSSATAEFPGFFATRPRVSAAQGTLLDVLRAPMLASPDSLSGQLAFMRENWAPILGPKFSETLRRTILAVDVLQEEEIAVWTMFHPGTGAGRHRQGDGKWTQEGFLGDEFVGFGEGAAIGTDGARSGPLELPQPLNEYEAFSPDQAWMPTVVMIAKSTYVWLEQLSKKYLRHIHRLDQIPGEELALLADRGINALWLIGLWERSTASQTIKRLMGQHDAVASAYSLKDYRIAEDLGGTYAYEQLRHNARRHGIRLASDMVPNHMGIDSTWVMEHPEWFLSRYDSPFPVYSFEGPDLSTESRFEIKIEDHYFNQSDAAVVFRLRERSNGDTRFVYHGNDGTTFAWNDTAQLDYSKSFVREHVIQTILSVAKLFPIIRFDAAMTLAKKHVQRLWFPLPGIGGSIPSRAEAAISQAEFDALMPHEFWREVVDRVAAEVPGTLLLAEAFWLLEGYFVRTLGMHRVYNSAFMNMLRDEENAKYRSYLKKTIEFDPDILKRYVNFMSNPDEETAIDQFGTGDKYFGTCTMLATIPGLPMFGHGQIEGFTEKYGMEYKQARYDEWPNEDLIARHQREIAPLLKNRQLFAESGNFAMYDLWVGADDVNENVFAYSNRVDHWGTGYGGSGKERALVLYNNSYASTHGTVHVSVGYMDKGSGELRQRTLSDALHLPSDPELFLAWKDSASGLEFIRRSSEFNDHGFTIGLRGYQYAVLGDWRELRATAEHPWDQLAGALSGAGVYNLDEALSKLRLRPLHEALRHALAPEILQVFSEAASGADSDIRPEIDLRLEEPPTTLATADETSCEPVAGPVEPALDAPDEMASPEEPLVEQTSPLLETHVTITASIGAILAPLAPVEIKKPSDTGVADSRLAKFFELAGLFFEQASLLEPAGSEQLVGAAQKAPVTKEFVTMAQACLLMSAAEEQFGTTWPESARHVLPHAADTSVSGVIGRTSQLWAPVLAWILIENIASEDGSPSTTELFDQFHLRSALAEIFGSIGIEGQDSWRFAARVRLLLALPGVTSLAQLGDAGLWDDPDLRWLAGLSESNGVTYVNKECFLEIVWWLQLPSLLQAAAEPLADRISEIEAFIASAGSAALTAGYDLSKLRGILAPKTKAAKLADTEANEEEDAESVEAESDLEPEPHASLQS